MRVVADTNVVISMLLWGKSLERLFVMVNRREIVLCFSPETIDELFRVIHYPHIRAQAEKFKIPIESLLDKLLAASFICYPSGKVAVITEDESDNRILESAREGGVACVITGDKHLLKLGSFYSIPIYTPAQFLALH
jgi:putative PIN family toxin of toxin-antitoxin system